MKTLRDFIKSQLDQFFCAPRKRGRKLQYPECLERASALETCCFSPASFLYRLDYPVPWLWTSLLPLVHSPEVNYRVYPLFLLAQPLSTLYQDGGRRSWWEIQKHSQQKQRPLGAAHLCDQVREAGSGDGGSGSTSALEGRRVSWVLPCWPLPSLLASPQPLPRAPTVLPFSLGLG